MCNTFCSHQLCTSGNPVGVPNQLASARSRPDASQANTASNAATETLAKSTGVNGVWAAFIYAASIGCAHKRCLNGGLSA